ncbi:MAG: type II secretion system protein [bacterium]|nr:type II secretion system protein [bacterium]
MLCKAHRGRGDGGACSAFTLVEMLVVVSIVSLLLAMLAPSLKGARAQARQVVCASHLSQWGVAFSCYTAENSGVMPHCDGLDRQDPDPDNPDYHNPKYPPWQVADWHGWVDVLPPMLNLKAWRYFQPREHPQAGTFYQCPSAQLADESLYSGYQPRRNGFFSYAMNSCLELDENAWTPPGGTDYPMPSFLDAARIVAPERVVLLFDQLLDPGKGYGGATRYGSAGQHCGSYPISFSARHAARRGKLGGNLLYCDGHAAWQETVWRPDWMDWDVNRQQGPPRSDPDWYPYPAPPAKN